MIDHSTAKTGGRSDDEEPDADRCIWPADPAWVMKRPVQYDT